MQGLVNAPARARPRRVLVCLALVVALASLVGCDYGTVSETTPDCAHSLRCELTVPPCGPVVTTSHFYDGFWDQNFTMPANAASFLGFALQLPMHIPQIASWHQVIIIRHATPQGGPPLLHASYIHFPPLGRDTNSILAFEETTGTIRPLTNLNYPDPTFHSGDATVFVKDSQTIHLATQPAIPATIYHLGVTGFPGAYASELIWTSGSLSMRLLAGVTIGLAEYTTEPTYSGGNSYPTFDRIEGSLVWEDPNDAMLQQVATSVTPFACPA